MSVLAAKPSPRSARTRAALIDAGLRLFAERPIDAVPVDDIVAAASVAKGSFFNHFDDKQAFANAIATEIRRDVEARVDAFNRDISDPLERLTGGMVVAAEFALSERSRALVMLRAMIWSTARNHPLNAGLRRDIDACIAAGHFNRQAARSGVPFWLGVCQTLMVSVLAQSLPRTAAAEQLRDTMQMALTGMGATPELADRLSQQCLEVLMTGDPE